MPPADALGMCGIQGQSSFLMHITDQVTYRTVLSVHLKLPNVNRYLVMYLIVAVYFLYDWSCCAAVTNFYCSKRRHHVYCVLQLWCLLFSLKTKDELVVSNATQRCLNLTTLMYLSICLSDSHRSRHKVTTTNNGRLKRNCTFHHPHRPS